MSVDSVFPPRRSARIYQFPLGCQMSDDREDAMSEVTARPGRARALFRVALCDGRGMALQSRVILRRQAAWLEESEFDVAERLYAHAVEKESQVARIEGILATLGTGADSGIEDAEEGARGPVSPDGALSFGGTMSALMHVAGDDGGAVKNVLTAVTMLQFEFATYESLLALGEAAGHHGALGPLARSQGEVRAMAAWLAEMLRPLTLRQLQHAAPDPFAAGRR